MDLLAHPVLALSLAFCAVAMLSATLIAALVPGPVQARLRQIAGKPPSAAAPGSGWQEALAAALSPAARLSLPAGGWENSALRRRFVQAGIRSEKAVLLFFGTKTALALALPLVFMLAIGLVGAGLTFRVLLACVVACAAIGYYLPNVHLRSRIAHRQREVFEALPDAIDMMTVMVEAGLGLDAAIARVAEEIGIRSQVLQEELRLVGLELRAGASREQALRNLAVRTGVEEVNLFISMLVQTDRFGTSMADSLRVHSESLRTKRRLRAEEAAAKIGVKLMFPLILFIFPSMMIVLMGPAVISIYRIFFPLVGMTP
jgi:tight adherence protein C